MLEWLEELRARWRSPRSLTALIPIEHLPVANLELRLKAIDRALIERLDGVKGLHFLRLVAVPPASGSGSRLLLNAVHDQRPREFVSDLSLAAETLFETLFAGESTVARPGNLAARLLASRVRENTFFIAAIGHDRDRVLEEAAICKALGAALDERLPLGYDGAESAEHTRLALRTEFLERFGDWEPRRQTLLGAILRVCDLVLKFMLFPLVGVAGLDMIKALRRVRSPALRWISWLAAGLWSLYGVVFTAAAFLLNRLIEIIEPDTVTPMADEQHLERLEDLEDRIPRNELTGWFPTKPGWVGRTVLRALLFGSECGVRHFWTDARLTGAQNIHFARLLIVDRGETMIFMSDYEGGFDAYLDHFIGAGGHTRAVVPIWSRLLGCPKTRWLYFQANPPEFRRRWKDMVRLRQVKATVWYSAYPFLSANDILRNARTCDGLFAESMAEQEAAQWFREL